jgi:TRAP-type C4-dicarboxylate transport system permease large subunit
LKEKLINLNYIVIIIIPKINNTKFRWGTKPNINKSRRNSMDWMKILGFIIYAIGIVGCVEGVFKKSTEISAVALVVVIVGSILIGFNDKIKSESK